VLLATFLALLPVAFIAVMATLDLRPWWRQLRYIRGLPETPEVSTRFVGRR